MKNTKVSKVMLSILVTGGLVFSSLFAVSASEVKAPSVTKGEAQIELPSSELEIFEYKFVSLSSLKEKEKIQAEREERLKIELEKARQAEEARLAKIEADKKAEAERQAKKTQSMDGVAFNGTYYTPYCKGCSGITATGIDVRSSIYYNDMRVIAVDPNIIPLYSIVEVSTPYESFKAIALDTGGAIKGHKVDILVANTKTALKLGRHTVYIKVLRNGK